MKSVDFSLGGQTYHLLLNAAALFDAYDHFGEKGDLLERLSGTSKESFDDTCWMLAKLAQQGEAYRRYTGMDRQPMLTEDRARALLSPQALLLAREAIREAYYLGFARTVHREDDEDIDLGLLELQKKTASASPGQNGSNGRPSFWTFLSRTR